MTLAGIANWILEGNRWLTTRLRFRGDDPSPEIKRAWAVIVKRQDHQVRYKYEHVSVVGETRMIRIQQRDLEITRFEIAVAHTRYGIQGCQGQTRAR